MPIVKIKKDDNTDILDKSDIYSPDDLKKLLQLKWEQKHIVHKQKHAKGFCSVTKNKRFKSYLFKGPGSKNLLKRFIQFKPEYKVVAQILDRKGYRQFIPFKSWDNCFDAYQHEAWSKRYLFEVILSDRPSKPYLDIEWKVKNVSDIKDELDKFIHDLKKDIICVFNERYGYKINNEMIYVLESHGDDKVSFHVIIHALVNNKLLVFNTNRKKEKNSSWDFYHALTKLNTIYEERIDGNVYTLDREFRSIYSNKFNDYRIMKPPGKDCSKKCIQENWKNYMVTYIPNDVELECIKTPEIITDNIKVAREARKKKDLIKKKHTENIEENDVVNRLLEMLQTLHPTAYFTNQTSNKNGFRFSYRDKTEPCFTGHIHKSNGFNVYIKPDTGETYVHCLSQKCDKLFKLGYFDRDQDWKNQVVRINQRHLKYTDGISDDIIFDNTGVKLSGLLNGWVDNGGFFCIKSNMGTGKTTMLKSLLPVKFNNKRILYLSHRQTFTQNIYGTFRKLNMENYMDIAKNKLYESDRLICQIDSIRHLLDGSNGLRKFDLIIMDEIESLLNHMSSVTLGEHRKQTCMILKQLLSMAPNVLCMDADFDDRAYEFVSRIKGKPIVVVNEFKLGIKRYLFNKNLDKMKFQLIEDIKRKKNVSIICLSKDMMDRLKNYIKDNVKNVKLISYSSMTDDKDKEKLKDVNNEWKEYQVILYTPTIEAGVDFSEKHFDKMYCFLSNGSCSPRAFLQMVGRIRYLSDINIRCYFDKSMKYTSKRSYVPGIDELEEYLMKNIYDPSYEWIEEDDYCTLKRKKDCFTRVFAHNMHEKMMKRSRFLDVLKELITIKEDMYIDESKGESFNEDNNIDAMDDDINSIDSTKNNKKVEIISQSSITNDNAIELECIKRDQSTIVSSKKSIYEMDELLACPIIDFERAEKIKKLKFKSIATREDKLCLKKYEIMRKFKIKEEEFTHEFLLNWYNKEYILDNALYAVGKLKIPKEDIERKKTMDMKIGYLKELLKVFGFRSLTDFNNVVERDNKMIKRMEKSGFMEKKKYDMVVTVFGKRNLKQNSKFSINIFIKFTDSILNEFGVKLTCNKKRIKYKKKLFWEYKYQLMEERNGIGKLAI